MTTPVIEATTRRTVDLNDDVVTAILLRLPSAAVARSRAVCLAWRGIATGAAFLAAHARRRPLELIVQRHGANGVLDAIPIATLDAAGRRCLHPGYPNRPPRVKRSLGRGYVLVASCDGLLLFERVPYIEYLVCDPVTRQWTELPPRMLTMACGFYLHGPSGEHRLLFLTNDVYGHSGASASHRVCSLEAGETRRLGPPVMAVDSFTAAITDCLDHRGTLHWLQHPEARESNKILAFDTVSETFRRMSHIDNIIGGLDLSASEVAAIKYIQNKLIEKDKEDLVRINGFKLNAKDLRCLIRPVKEDGTEKWLCSHIMSICGDMLNSHWQKEPKQLRYIASTYYSNYLRDLGKDWIRTGAYNKRLSTNAHEMCQNFVGSDLVFIPVNNTASHWWLCVLCPAKRQVQVLDSYDRRINYDHETRELRNGIHALLDAVLSKWQLQSRWSHYDILNWYVFLRDFRIKVCTILEWTEFDISVLTSGHGDI
ncbi:hypothetical protein ACP4OV_021346 [Aristida adscensionis]